MRANVSLHQGLKLSHKKRCFRKAVEIGIVHEIIVILRSRFVCVSVACEKDQQQVVGAGLGYKSS